MRIEKRFNYGCGAAVGEIEIEFNDSELAVSELKINLMMVDQQQLYVKLKLKLNDGGLAVSELKRESMMVVEQQ